MVQYLISGMLGRRLANSWTVLYDGGHQPRFEIIVSQSHDVQDKISKGGKKDCMTREL